MDESWHLTSYIIEDHFGLSETSRQTELLHHVVIALHRNPQNADIELTPRYPSCEGYLGVSSMSAFWGFLCSAKCIWESVQCLHFGDFYTVRRVSGSQLNVCILGISMHCEGYLGVSSMSAFLGFLCSAKGIWESVQCLHFGDFYALRRVSGSQFNVCILGISMQCEGYLGVSSVSAFWGFLCTAKGIWESVQCLHFGDFCALRRVSGSQFNVCILGISMHCEGYLGVSSISFPGIGSPGWMYNELLCVHIFDCEKHYIYLAWTKC